MNDDLLKISLIQGKQFNKYQTNIKKNVNAHFKFKFKEGFVTAEQEKILRPKQKGYISVLEHQKQYNDLTKDINKKDLDDLKELQTNYTKLLSEYESIKKTIDTKSLSVDPVIPQEDQVKFDTIKNKLYILGKDILSKMENLYNQDNKVYEQLNMNAQQFQNDLEKYKGINIKIRQEANIQSNHNIESMQNYDGSNSSNKFNSLRSMNDIDGMLSDTGLRVLQGNYSYILWSILAAGLLTITINTMNK